MRKRVSKIGATIGVTIGVMIGAVTLFSCSSAKTRLGETPKGSKSAALKANVKKPASVSEGGSCAPFESLVVFGIQENEFGQNIQTVSMMSAGDPNKFLKLSDEESYGYFDRELCISSYSVSAHDGESSWTQYFDHVAGEVIQGMTGELQGIGKNQFLGLSCSVQGVGYTHYCTCRDPLLTVATRTNGHVRVKNFGLRQVLGKLPQGKRDDSGQYFRFKWDNGVLQLHRSRVALDEAGECGPVEQSEKHVADFELCGKLGDELCLKTMIRK